MKKIISIGYVGLLVCTLGFTSCVDEHDTPFIRYCQLVIEISTFIIPYNDSFNTCLTFNLSISI